MCFHPEFTPRFLTCWSTDPNSNLSPVEKPNGIRIQRYICTNRTHLFNETVLGLVLPSYLSDNLTTDQLGADQTSGKEHPLAPVIHTPLAPNRPLLLNEHVNKSVEILGL